MIGILLVITGVTWYGWKTGKLFSKKEITNNKIETIETKKNITETTDFYTIKAEYPIEPWDKDGVLEQFVKQIVDQKKEEWKIGGEAYNSEKETEDEYSDRPKMVYESNIFYEKFESKKMGTVSYLFKISEYTGGANANEEVQTFTFSKEGKMDIESFLNISDSQLVNGKKIPNDIALSRMIFEKTQNDLDNFPDTDMVSDGLGLSYLGADGITLDHKKCNCDGFFYGSNLQNFVVTDNGLVFYFGKGNITARVAGSIGIELNWESLKPYLNK